MKYVFGLSYIFKKYKSKSRITLHTNGNLLDEITLEEDSDIVVKKRSEADRHILSRQPSRIPEKMHVIELDGDAIGDTIDLSYENHDNNYTNGFMTQFSYIEFHSIFLLPKFCLDRAISHRLFLSDRLSNEYNLNVDRPQWPIAYDGIRISGSSDIKPSKLYHNHKIGGKLQIIMPVIKKHGIKMFGDKQKARGLFKTHRMTFLMMHYHKLLNIYNEDQRSNRTKD